MPSAALSARVRRRVALAALAALGLAACAPPDAPQPIVYDKEPCAHCRMLISDPSFAAQLQTQDGDVQNFDDPGCLLAALATRAPKVRALWFHHVREDRWLDAAHVAFEEVQHSPMGYRLGAVAAGTPHALSLDDARARVVELGVPSESRP